MVVMGPGFSGKRDENWLKAVTKFSEYMLSAERVEEIVSGIPAFKKKYADILGDSTLTGAEKNQRIQEKRREELREEFNRFKEQRDKLEKNNE